MAAKRIVSWVLSLVLGGVFFYAGISKVSMPPNFALDIMNYRIVPWPVAVVMAVFLPWVEIFSALGLLLPGLRKGALLLMAAMLLMFLAALASAAVRQLDITCGCFGDSMGEVVPAFLRNCVLFTMALVLIARERNRG